MTESELPAKKCDICLDSSNTSSDTLIFGDWMERSNIRVHYFCLLLSTYLPQRGERDCSGILGFLMRDIRHEIEAAKRRICCYCDRTNAHIACATCGLLFHLYCGRRANCLNQFYDQFLSFCSKCVPLSDFQRSEALKKLKAEQCDICFKSMGPYNPVQFIYATCCNNGYVHRLCMQKYALDAGYYLRCLWCRATGFREHVRRWGIFVPDRDALWEQQKDAYSDLHRGHMRCDMDPCNCPGGRTYFTKKKWQFILCKLCGSVGAHNPACIPGKPKSRAPLDFFQCETCIRIINDKKQRSVISTSKTDGNYADYIDMSVYISKQANAISEPSLNETSDFSDDESHSSQNSLRTVLSAPESRSSVESGLTPDAEAAEEEVIDLCTQSPLSDFDEDVGTQPNAIANSNQLESSDFPYKCSVDGKKSVQCPLLKSQIVEETVDSVVVLRDLDEISECDKATARPADSDLGAQQAFPTIIIADSESTGFDDIEFALAPNEQVHQAPKEIEFFIFQNLKCRGMCTVRTDKDIPNFDEITMAEMEQFFATDEIVKVTDDTGIFAKIDALLKELTSRNA